MTNIVIVSAARTALGSFNGTLAFAPCGSTGGDAIKEALSRAKVAPAESLRSHHGAGSLCRSSAWAPRVRRRWLPVFLPIRPLMLSIRFVDRACVRLPTARMAIKAGDAKVIIAGDLENMSLSHHSIFLRNGVHL